MSFSRSPASRLRVDLTTDSDKDQLDSVNNHWQLELQLPDTRPLAGFRISLNSTSNCAFPAREYALDPPCTDLDGFPTYFGSALFTTAVYPCKIAPHDDHPCRVFFNGEEVGHTGLYDLLPFDRSTMELVPIKRFEIPTGKTPVIGGYEKNRRTSSGGELYHGIARHDFKGRETLVPGMVGKYLVRSFSA